MHIRDILKFNKDKYFGGAVQANWFYDADKVSAIACLLYTSPSPRD